MSYYADKKNMGIVTLKTLYSSWKSAAFSLIIVISIAIFLFSTDSKATAVPIHVNEQTMETVENLNATLPVIREVQETFIKSGSTLSLHLSKHGVSPSDNTDIIKTLVDLIDLRRLKAGQKIDLIFENNIFAGITIPISIDKEVSTLRMDSGFFAREVYKDLQTYPSTIETVVDSSLYKSAVDAGIHENIIMELIQLYSFDVDFQRDIQNGDVLKVCYEIIYDEQGKAVDSGNILYTSLVTGGELLKIYRYTDLAGKTDFFDELGHTVRKTLLKTPINGAYITSAYGYRTHPINGYTSMHKGTDFGAPRGTPIKTSGDGTVRFAGYNHVYGNHVIVRHVNSYETLYAHMTAFARGIRPGRKVDQGQVIGYVGSTGMSTGPHLHYEVKYNGRQVNPNSIKFPPGRTLEGDDARLYKNMLESYAASLP